MDAKTEAKRIFNLFFLSSLKVSQKQAKEFSLITVNEIKKNKPTNPLLGSYVTLYSEMIDQAIEFWNEVETEIKLINENNK